MTSTPQPETSTLILGRKVAVEVLSDDTRRTAVEEAFG